MFNPPPSHVVAHRDTRRFPIIQSTIAVLAIASLALGACSAPSAGGVAPQPEPGAFPQTFDSWDSLRREHQPRAVVNPAAATDRSDDTWDSLRKEHQRATR
jgi:hypothetical protein